jgi:hypothetical protein
MRHNGVNPVEKKGVSVEKMSGKSAFIEICVSPESADVWAGLGRPASQSP